MNGYNLLALFFLLEEELVSKKVFLNFYVSKYKVIIAGQKA